MSLSVIMVLLLIAYGSVYAPRYTVPQLPERDYFVYVPPALILPKIDAEYTPLDQCEYTELGRRLQWVIPNEWADAREIRLNSTKAPSEGYLLLKFAEDFDYFALDIITAQSIWESTFLGLDIDPLHDKGNLPQKDDVTIDFFPNTGTLFVRKGPGNDEGWAERRQINQSSSLSVVVQRVATPRSEWRHLFYECRISRSQYSGTGDSFGLWICCTDNTRGYVGFPPFVWWIASRPSLWANVYRLPVDEKYAIPEFPTYAILPTAMICLLGSFVACRVSCSRLKRTVRNRGKNAAGREGMGLPRAANRSLDRY